jgi:hypothetical protein
LGLGLGLGLGVRGCCGFPGITVGFAASSGFGNARAASRVIERLLPSRLFADPEALLE